MQQFANDMSSKRRIPRTIAQANLAITNMFKRDEAGVWKMVAHQAGLVQE